MMIFCFSLLVHALFDMHCPVLNASGECNSTGIMLKFTELYLTPEADYKSNPSGFSRATELNASQWEKEMQLCC